MISRQSTRFTTTTQCSSTLKCSPLNRGHQVGGFRDFDCLAAVTSGMTTSLSELTHSLEYRGLGNPVWMGRHHHNDLKFWSGLTI